MAISPSASVCRTRAAAEELAATETSLDNVRERHIRARDTWIELAERAEYTSTMRETIIAEKAAQKEAEEAAAEAG